MQTPNRKLSLHRETVRVLTAQVLGLARGGKGGKLGGVTDTDDIYWPTTTSKQPPSGGNTICECQPSEIT